MTGPECLAAIAPIAIRCDHVVDTPTRLRIQQHGKGLSNRNFTVFRTSSVKEALEDVSSKSSAEKAHQEEIFHVTGKYMSAQEKHHFTDASGLPLFELYHTTESSTWRVKLPGDDSTSIAQLSPRLNSMKDDLELTVNNAAGDNNEVILQVKGQDIWKQRTNVYLDGTIVMTAKRVDKWSTYVPGRKNEWDVDVAPGMDLSLASVVVVVLAANMYTSGFQGGYAA